MSAASFCNESADKALQDKIQDGNTGWQTGNVSNFFSDNHYSTSFVDKFDM